MNKTGIQYLDFTWNPVTGCTKGCPECWARALVDRMLKNHALRNIHDKLRGFKPTLYPERLDQPQSRKSHAVIGVGLMGELFDPALSDDSRAEVHAAILKANWHTYVLLTKRPDLMADYYEMQGPDCEGELIPDVYLGFSARTQAEFDAGWPHMAKLAAAGWKVWVSLEPMQEEIWLHDAAQISTELDTGRIVSSGWKPALTTVIVGAQSGKNAVPFQDDWARLIRDQCAAAGVPFMYKQGHDKQGRVVDLPELDGQRHTAVAWSNLNSQ